MLFRGEAVRAHGEKALGEPSLAQPLPLRALAGLLVLLVAAVGVYLYRGEYARKTTVAGYLEPTSGLVEVYPGARSGIVNRLLVAEGATVERGDALVELRFPSALAPGEEAASRLLAELTLRARAIERKLEEQERSTAAERERLRERIDELAAELDALERYAGLQRERVAIAERRVAALVQLRDGAHVSEGRWLQGVAAELDQRKSLARIRHEILQTRRAWRTAARDLDRVTSAASDERLQLTLELSQVRERIVEARGRAMRLIEASADGVVTALQAREGAWARRGTPLLAIVPVDARLECVLLIPSEALGFVEPGMSVRLMLDSYPHEQYGTQPATLTHVARAPVAPRELAAPVESRAPVYIARARLERQFVAAYGKREPLHAGMQVRADIVLEERSLMDWLLEPLLSLRGRS